MNSLVKIVSYLYEWWFIKKLYAYDDTSFKSEEYNNIKFWNAKWVGISKINLLGIIIFLNTN